MSIRLKLPCLSLKHISLSMQESESRIRSRSPQQIGNDFKAIGTLSRPYLAKNEDRKGCVLQISICMPHILQGNPSLLPYCRKLTPVLRYSKLTRLKLTRIEGKVTSQ